MKLVPFISIIFLLLLAIPANSESYITGPFNISFDMGFPANLSIDTPVKTETYIGQPLTNYQLGGYTNHSLLIYIGEFDNTTSFPIDLKTPLSSYDQVSIVDRDVDGHGAKFGSGYKDGKRLYTAGWWMDNRTAINFVSTYPWDEGTRQLLNTIHVSKSS